MDDYMQVLYKGIFIGHGTNENGIPFEGFIMPNGNIEYYSTIDGSKLPNR